MKTSDPAAYGYISQITANADTILSYRALLITHTTTATITISGTSWENDAAGDYKTVTFAVNLNTGSALTFLLPLSLRTVSSISAGTVYGLR